MTQPAQPGPAPPGGKSGAWDHSFPLTLTCHASASPQLQPPTSSNPPSPPAAQPGPMAALSLLSGGRLCLLATRSHSLSRSRHPLTDTSEGRLTETWPPLLLSHRPVPVPLTMWSVPGWLLSPSRAQHNHRAGPRAPCSFLDSGLSPRTILLLVCLLWNVSGALLGAKLCAPQIPMLKPKPQCLRM